MTMLFFTFAPILSSLAPYGGGLFAGISYALYLVFWVYALFHIFVRAQQGKSINVRNEVSIASVISAICSILYFLDSIQRGQSGGGFGGVLFLTGGWLLSTGVFYIAYRSANERAKSIQNERRDQ